MTQRSIGAVELSGTTDSAGNDAGNFVGETTEQGLHAGERNVSSPTNGYQVVRKECTGVLINVNTSVTIGGGVAGDTHLMGITILNTLGGTLVIGGFNDETGGARSLNFPTLAAGYYEFNGMVNDAGALTVLDTNAGDVQRILVHYRAV